MWRPKEKEWAKVLLTEVKKIPDPKLLKGDIPAALILFAEAGADALLKALRSEGVHINIGQVLELEGEKIEATKNQTLVLIPDEEQLP